MIDQSVLDQITSNGQPAQAIPLGARRDTKPPSDATVDVDAPPPVEDGHPSDPGNIQDRLDQWAAWYDWLVEQLGDARRAMSKSKHALDLARAKVRKESHRKASVWRGSYVQREDVDAEVEQHEVVMERRRQADEASDRFWHLRELTKNAQANISRLQSQARTSVAVHPPGV